MPHSFGKCTLLTIEGIENLVSYLQISCLQIGVVPFEIKGVFVRNNEPDLHNVNESPKIGRLPFNNKRNQMQPIKRKLKSLTETPEEKEKEKQNSVNIRKRKILVYNSTITDEIRKFHANISRGPEYICSCCNQLWYKHSVITAEKLRLSNSTAGKYLLSKTSVDGIEWICQSCYKYLKKDKIPPCAAKNGMSFPAKPDFFYLNELECRMLAPRLAFEKLLQAPRGNQFKIKGNVVNVPAEVNNTVNMLPRLPQESGTIKVQLKRRLENKSSALSLNVRPNKIFQAANWLATNSTLYREQGISFSTDRATSYKLITK